jgi:tRNA U34 5-carboxymethylaminomethyl modifying GTPase MnmE/TrmE
MLNEISLSLKFCRRSYAHSITVCLEAAILGRISRQGKRVLTDPAVGQRSVMAHLLRYDRRLSCVVDIKGGTLDVISLKERTFPFQEQNAQITPNFCIAIYL